MSSLSSTQCFQLPPHSSLFNVCNVFNVFNPHFLMFAICSMFSILIFQCLQCVQCFKLPSYSSFFNVGNVFSVFIPLFFFTVFDVFNVFTVFNFCHIPHFSMFSLFSIAITFLITFSRQVRFGISRATHRSCKRQCCDATTGLILPIFKPLHRLNPLEKSLRESTNITKIEHQTVMA